MVTLQPGLIVCHTVATSLGAVSTTKTFDGDCEFIHLNCQLAGKFTGRVGSHPLDFSQGDVSLGFSAGERFQIQHCDRFENLTVMVTPDVLCELAGKKCAPCSAPKAILDSSSGMRDSAENRFVLPKALPAYWPRLRVSASCFTLQPSTSCIGISPRSATAKTAGDSPCANVGSWKNARALLLQDLSTPPTIAELAKAVGMNQCKLKKCFKDHFGSTIYALFQEQRMSSAQQLLQSYNVTETAMMLGYSNVSHFSAAFAKQFGNLPEQGAPERHSSCSGLSSRLTADR
ncbi:AraC family transcriptional regulator [Pseudomonas aeruginosa]|nr:AraC family transcriptional regulator [Pseudomonas aeruginosa]